MQRAIALLQGDRRGDYTDGVQVGRQIFSHLPPENRLRQREEQRWSLENQRDANFADMYVHPQEIDYTIETLFELIDGSGLDFLGFSNPRYWDLNRLIGTAPDLVARSQGLGERERYQLVELLDPEITHYEFFLAKPPFPRVDWQDDDRLRQAQVQRQPCLEGWPSRSLFDADYQIVSLTDAEFQALTLADVDDDRPTVAAMMAATGLSLDEVRSLQQRQLIVLIDSDRP
jgi:hypothetical protein